MMPPDERDDCERAAMAAVNYAVALRAAVDRGDRAEMAHLIERIRQPLQVLVCSATADTTTQEIP